MLLVASTVAADSGDLTEPKESVTKLNLSHKRLRDIDFIVEYPNLEELDLTWNSIRSIAPLLSLKKLRKLSLHGCSIIGDLGLLGKVTSLQSLDMSLVYINDDMEYPTLDFIRSLKNLEEIDISDNACLYKINPLAILPKLRSVTLKTGYSGCIEDWFSLNHFFTLKELTIYKEDIKRFPHLEGVTIRLE